MIKINFKKLKKNFFKISTFFCLTFLFASNKTSLLVLKRV